MNGGVFSSVHGALSQPRSDLAHLLFSIAKSGGKEVQSPSDLEKETVGVEECLLND